MKRHINRALRGVVGYGSSGFRGALPDLQGTEGEPPGAALPGTTSDALGQLGRYRGQPRAQGEYICLNGELVAFPAD